MPTPEEIMIEANRRKEPATPPTPAIETPVQTVVAEPVAPQVEAAVVEQPAATAEPTAESLIAEPTATTFNWAEQTGGKYDSWESVQQTLAQLEQKKAEYESQLNQVVNPWANEKLKGLNAFVKQSGINDIGAASQIWDKIASFDPATADPLEVAVLGKILGNPAMIPFQDRLKQDLREQYGLDDHESDDFAFNQAKLISDTREMVSKIADIKTKVTSESETSYVPPAQFSQEKVVQEWSPVIDTLASSLSALEIPAETDGKITKGFSFNVEKAQLSEIAKGLLEQVKIAGAPLTEDNVNYIKGQIVERAIVANLPKIVSVAKQQAYEQAKQEFDAKYNNPSGLRTAQPNGTETGLSPQEYTRRQAEKIARG